MRTEKAVPIKPENNANIKYKVPISLALEDKNHLSFHIVISIKLFSNSISDSCFILLLFFVIPVLVRVSLVDTAVNRLLLTTLTVGATDS